jgi:hypothetical protein
MADSEARRKAIGLGKKLVLELGPEHETDTLTRWMAHYVSEQIITAESATGVKKAAAEERCFNTVLALWAHRTKLPNGFRPFAGFEPILRALARLDPDEPRPFYFPPLRPNKTNDEEQEPDEVERLLEMILSIDRAARVLIELCLKSAAEKASTESTKIFLREALPKERGGDIEAVTILLERTERDRGTESDALTSAAIKRFESRLGTLDWLCTISRRVRQGFATELKKLRKTQPKRKSRSAANQVSQRN